MSPKWLNRRIVETVHTEQLAEHGGGTGIRNEELLESALARSQQIYAYDDTADICTLAAAYGYGIAKNHPFVDGNKRTAYVTMLTFLLVNGYRLTAAMSDRYDTMLAVASGDMEESTLASWLRENTAPTTDN